MQLRRSRPRCSPAPRARKRGRTARSASSCPFPPGGGGDTIARIVGAKLTEIWGQQIIVENKGGAGGNIASDATARSAPDGYTLFLTRRFPRHQPVHLSEALLRPGGRFRCRSRWSCAFRWSWCVPNSSPANTFAEFVALAKASSSPLTYASPGYGTSPHLAAELLKREAEIELTHVPYRGAAPAIQDLIPGRVDSFFNNIAPTVPLMKEGQLRGIAVTSAKRAPAMPDLPTAAESGLPGFDVSGWYAFVTPAKTPPEIIAKMSADTVTALTIRRRGASSRTWPVRGGHNADRAREHACRPSE